MPKSRHNKATENRLRKRLTEAAWKAGMYENLLTLTEAALEGMGLEATYFDQPRPHVVIDKREDPKTP